MHNNIRTLSLIPPWFKSSRCAGALTAPNWSLPQGTRPWNSGTSVQVRLSPPSTWAPMWQTSSWAACGRKTTSSASPCQDTSTIWTRTTLTGPYVSSRSDSQEFEDAIPGCYQWSPMKVITLCVKFDFCSYFFKWGKMAVNVWVAGSMLILKMNIQYLHTCTDCRLDRCL